MGFMRKQMLLQQRASYEQTLKERLSFLEVKGGAKALHPDKDTIVRKLKADIKAVNARIRVIAANEKRTEEMARTKAERAAAPKKKEEAAPKSEKPKKAPEEGKAKKVKPEGAKKKAEGPKEAPAAPAKTTPEA